MLLSAACSDEPTAAHVGTIRVTVHTSGNDVDADGYSLTVGGTGFQRTLGTQETVDVRTVAAGTHTVTLGNVAANCAGNGELARSVTVVNGRTTDVAFEIVCTGTGIIVTTRTTGVDNPDNYGVVVDDRPTSSVPANGSVTVGRLAPGSYNIALAIPGTHCTVVGGGQATVVAGSLTPVQFDVSCVAPTRSEKIAFALDTLLGGTRENWIGVMNPDGSGGVLYARGDTPAWSADRTKIIFSDAKCHPIDYYGVTFSCDGDVQLVDPETHNTSTIDEAFGGFDPTWAPTNDAIAYLSCCDMANQPGQLLLRPLDRPGARPLVIPGVATIRDPAWSPDGQRLAFACVVGATFDTNNANWDICIANRDGTDFFRLTSDSTRDTHPAWSPDGRRIAFSRDQDIAIITFGEPGLTRLTTGFDPAWSPDGTRLVFAELDGLFTINADGTSRQRLATGFYSAPAWRP
jgi:WD40 repeat protein